MQLRRRQWRNWKSIHKRQQGVNRITDQSTIYQVLGFETGDFTEKEESAVEKEEHQVNESKESTSKTDHSPKRNADYSDSDLYGMFVLERKQEQNRAPSGG